MAREQHPSQMLRDALLAAEPGSVLGGLSVTDRSVLSNLVQYADWDTGENARPGAAALAVLVGCHPVSVSKSIAKLIDRGLIERTKRAVPGRAAVYRCNLRYLENGAGTLSPELPDE